MKRRFTIIQGGLTDARAELIPADAVFGDRWRVVVRAARTIDDAEIADWRALAARNATGPFADPDFLLTAARHDPSATIVFALAYAQSDDGRRCLGAVLPLELPHPVWGESLIRLWHPSLAPGPVEPVLDPGVAASALEAVVAHCVGRRSRSGLLLAGIRRDGELLQSITSDPRLGVAILMRPAPIPAESFVEVYPRLPAPEIEPVTDPEAIRDAVEHVLLLEARRSRNPVLADPSKASAIRVATRLFARRGMACVDLGRIRGEIVSAAIRLGRPDDRVTWRSVDVFEPAMAALPTVDAKLTLAADVETAPRRDRVRLLAP